MRLKRIEQLRDCLGWTEYMRPRIVGILTALERDALENEKLTADEVMRKREAIREVRGVLRAVEQDARVSGEALRRRT